MTKPEIIAIAHHARGASFVTVRVNRKGRGTLEFDDWRLAEEVARRLCNCNASTNMAQGVGYKEAPEDSKCTGAQATTS